MQRERPKYHYEVIVGGIRKVHEGRSRSAAYQTYYRFAEVSAKGVGAAAYNQTIEIFRNGESQRKFTPRAGTDA